MKMKSSRSSQYMNFLINKFDAISTNEERPVCDASIVIFHLDTTDRNTENAEICQIAASCQRKLFNKCLLPDGNFLSKATDKHGFEKKGNKLFHYGKEVIAVSPKDGLQKFLDFLSELTGNTRKVLLAAHSCSTFHRYIVVRLMKQYDLFDTFKSLVLGFIDTMNFFKEALPKRKSYKLRDLAKDCLDNSTISRKKHAVTEVNILASLIPANKICIDIAMKQYEENLDEFIRFIDLKRDFKKVAKDANDEKNTITTLKKIAKAGITIDILKDTYRANPDDGISNLLQEKEDGKPRVKIQSSTIKKINDKIKELCDKDDNTAGSGTA